MIFIVPGRVLASLNIKVVLFESALGLSTAFVSPVVNQLEFTRPLVLPHLSYASLNIVGLKFGSFAALVEHLITFASWSRHILLSVTSLLSESKIVMLAISFAASTSGITPDVPMMPSLVATLMLGVSKMLYRTNALEFGSKSFASNVALPSVKAMVLLSSGFLGTIRRLIGAGVAPVPLY